MTHLQKITTLAKKIRKQHPNKKWTDCVKAASNELKAGKKVAGYTGTRRDGNKTTVFYTNKKIGALPINLHGSFLGYKFKVINQFTIDGKVEAQIVHDDKIISYIDGTKQQLDNTRKILIAGAIAAGGNLLSYRSGETKRDIKELERNIGKFVESLNNEVKNFNSGKDVRTKTQKPIKLTYKPETKKLATIDKVKKILFDDRKRLQHGYKLVPAKKLTMKKIAGEKHTDTKSHNVRISIGKKINGIPMIKLTKDSFTRVNNDTNGNPRYAIHFLDILNNEEKNSSSTLDSKYNLALKKAKKINGKKYHNKLYGGGIVFQSYNLDSLLQRIKDII